MTQNRLELCLALSSCVSLLTAVGCTDDAIEPTDTMSDEIGDGDGDTTGDGDGDPTGDGDGDPTGDGDGDPGGTCDDGEQNQDETDVDCGGLTCETCADGSMCQQNEDCMSGTCLDGMCFAGCLEDTDCDGLDDDCNEGVCNMGACEAMPVNDGMACASEDLCLTNGMCDAGTCMEEPLDCTALDGECSVGACDPEDGECVAEPINEGMACDDGDACSMAEVCTAGVCEDPEGGSLFYDEFANNDAGWTLGTEWEIGSATAGCGDPGTDHTPTDNNGVAGVVLGDCATTVLHDYYCLTSPVIDTAGEAEVWMSYYRDLYSDYTPYMKNKLEVFDGNAWVILFETFGSPGVNDASWTYFSYDVSAYANANMQFRWCHNIGSNGAFNRGSWNVDDVTVASLECNGAD